MRHLPATALGCLCVAFAILGALGHHPGWESVSCAILASAMWVYETRFRPQALGPTAGLEKRLDELQARVNGLAVRKGL